MPDGSRLGCTPIYRSRDAVAANDKEKLHSEIAVMQDADDGIQGGRPRLSNVICAMQQEHRPDREPSQNIQELKTIRSFTARMCRFFPLNCLGGGSWQE
jgi:hypothetical protein